MSKLNKTLGFRASSADLIDPRFAYDVPDHFYMGKYFGIAY